MSNASADVPSTRDGRQRVTFREADHIRRGVVAKVDRYIRNEFPVGATLVAGFEAQFPADSTSELKTALVGGLSGIAEGTLTGLEVSEFAVFAGTLAVGWSAFDPDLALRAHAIPGDERLHATARIVFGLAHARAVSGGNLPFDPERRPVDEDVNDSVRNQLIENDLDRVRQALPDDNYLDPSEQRAAYESVRRQLSAEHSREFGVPLSPEIRGQGPSGLDGI